MSYSLAVPDLTKIAKLAEKFPEVAEAEVNMAINRSLLRLKREAVLEAPVGVTGAGKNLRDDWEIKVGRFEGSIRNRRPYAIDVQKGTRPHWVSIEEITPWAKSKGIPPFLVARAISRHGTKANPFFTRAIDSAADGIRQEFRTALQNISKKVLQ